MTYLHGLFGLLCLLATAWAFSENRKRPPLKMVAVGIGLQFLIAVLLLKVDVFQQVFLGLNGVVVAIQSATEAGTGFAFGYLGGGDLPFQESYPGASFILAFRALPIILVMSALSALLYHWRVLPWIVERVSGLLRRSMGVGGAVGISTAANIFVGMVEAPLFIRPYVHRLSRSELFIVMTAGMATIAGTMMVLYASVLQNVVSGALGHILTASLISAPAAIVIARLMVPVDAGDGTEADAAAPTGEAENSMDAITRGTLEGVSLLINVIALLIVLVALVSLANACLGLLPDMNGDPLTLQRLFGWALAPLAWAMGIPWAEAQVAGSLLGTKTVLNEFLAYLELANLSPEALSERSRLILVYAICGFANFGSLGILIGGLGTIAPERRAEIAGLGLKSILAGTITTCMTGTIVGLIL